MAVSTTNGFDGPYTANGVTTSFPFTFTAPTAGEVSVLLRDAAGVESVAAPSLYTVTLGSVSGGTVVFGTAPATGNALVVYLDPAFTQEIAFEDGSAWRASPVNEQADRSAARDQALKREAGRALMVPMDETGLRIPLVADRAEKAMFFDAAGNIDPISIDDFAAPAQAASETADMLFAAIIAVAAGFAFDTTAAGVDPVTGVATGEYFVTWEGSRVRLYLNAAGVAVEKAEFATKAMLDALASGVADDVLASVSADLAGTGGAALVGFIQNLTNATARTGQTKLRDTVSPEDFGAVGDGVADDTTAVVNAINSGRIVDGNGKTYALGTPVVPGGNVKGIRNCAFKWTNTTVMAQQQFMLAIIDKSNLLIENLTFDLGTVENCGSANDSTRGGLKISTTSEGVTYNDYLTVRNIRVFGYGNGTGVYIRSWRYSTFDGIKVYNRQVAASPDPSNDCQNGVDISIGKSGTISNIISRDQTTRLAGTLTKRYSRGVLHFELQDCALTNYAIENVDQGLDLSGAITATLTKGNMGLSLSSMSATGCYTYGFKFANCSHDIAASGLVAREFGFVGFVFAGPNSTPLDATKNTQRIVLSGCHAFDPTGAFGGTNCYGFRLMQSATYSSGFPRGIKMIGCTVADTTGGGKLYQGFTSDVTYDGSGYFNEIIGCSSVGHVNAASSGFTYTVAQLPASAPMGTRLTVSDSNSTAYNAVAAGGGSSNVSVRFNSNTNDWRIG